MSQVIIPPITGGCAYCHATAIAAISSPTCEPIAYCGTHTVQAHKDVTMTHYMFAESPYGLLMVGAMVGCNQLYGYDDIYVQDCQELGLDPATLFYANSDDVAQRPDLQLAVQYRATRYADLKRHASHAVARLHG